MNEFHTDSFESSSFSSSDVAPAEHRPDYWTDDGAKNTFQDTYTARQRVFPDGQCEIVISHEKFFIGPAIIAKPKAKRGESEDRERSEDVAGRRAKKTVRMCCKQIGADRMVTLTYRENMIDREQAIKHWKSFCRRVGKHRTFLYVAVIEEQQRGALHFHVAVNGRQNYNLLRSIWQSVLGLGPSGEKMGQVNVRDPHRFGFGKNGAHKLASYIAKYCSKTMECRDLNEKRYFRSRGIALPEVNTWRIVSTSMLGAVQTAFAIAQPYGLEGVQTWCNNGLGVVWLATAPRSGPLVADCPF